MLNVNAILIKFEAEFELLSFFTSHTSYQRIPGLYKILMSLLDQSIACTFEIRLSRLYFIYDN